MPLRAALFDVGDTLVDGWIGPERTNALILEALRERFGDHDWYQRWLAAEIRPPGVGRGGMSVDPIVDDEVLRQETNHWYEEWFHSSSIDISDIGVDVLRSAMCVPLDQVGTLSPGAVDAVRWCKRSGLAVVIVSNTLSRGDAEIREDWRRFGLIDAIDGVVSSHDVGWQKPHRRIFERALEVARVRPDEAVMIGDRLDADVWGSKRLGMRAVLRRSARPQAPVDVTPDATIDDLTELPGVLSAWLDVPTAQRSTRGD